MKKFIGSLTGYLYDPFSGLVFSTKRTGAPVPMKWQDGPSGQYLYLSRRDGSRYRITPATIQMNEKVLFGAQEVPTAETAPAPKHGFIVGSVNGASISFAAAPKVHPTEQAARNEAERLVKAFPEKTFLVAELKGRVKARSVVWE